MVARWEVSCVEIEGGRGWDMGHGRGSVGYEG